MARRRKADVSSPPRTRLFLLNDPRLDASIRSGVYMRGDRVRWDNKHLTLLLDYDRLLGCAIILNIKGDGMDVSHPGKGRKKASLTILTVSRCEGWDDEIFPRTDGWAEVDVTTCGLDIAKRVFQ